MRAPRRQAGFSLIEVMVAVAVLAVALTGLTRGLTTALGASRDSAQHTQAVLLAASRVEQLRAEGDWSAGETEGKAEAFRWRQTIAATAVEGLHEVKVAVSRPPEEAPVFTLMTLLYQAPSDLPAGKDKATDATRARRQNRRSP